MTDILESPPPRLDAAIAVELMHDHYGIDGEAMALPSERDQNFRITTAAGRTYLLKVANEAERPETIEFENSALEHLRRHAPQLPVPRLIEARVGNRVVCREFAGTTYRLRVLSWLDGVVLRELVLTDAMRRALGTALAELGLGLRGFLHPAAQRDLLWDISNAGRLETYLDDVSDSRLRDLCCEHIRYFNEHVAPELGKLRAQVVYNDLNPSNVLVSGSGEGEVTGIVDFGDMAHAPLICDVAIAAAYQFATGSDPFAGALEFVAAYHRVVPLQAAELTLLVDLIRTRLVTTVVITSWRARLYPENREYILRSAAAAVTKLESLNALGRAAAVERTLRACPTVAIEAAATIGSSIC